MALTALLASLAFGCWDGQPGVSDRATPAPAARHGARFYAADSPWNLKIGPEPAYEKYSSIYLSTLKGVFGADPNQYTIPLYEITSATPCTTVTFSGVYSNVTAPTVLALEKRGTAQIPIPAGAAPAAGTDAQFVVWNPQTGDEWGFWKAAPQPDGAGWQVRNGYHYNTNWSGVPPLGFISRGAGVPYLTGLIRPWEIEQGRIDHALAVGVNVVSPISVFPATKSDGAEDALEGLPAGARIQLDPALGEDDFSAWGLNRTGQIIARALQDYGMIVVDGSDHPKLYVEYEATAKWGVMLDANTVRAIPYSAFRVLSLSAPKAPPAPTDLSAAVSGAEVTLTWQPVSSATRYRVKRRAAGAEGIILLNDWVVATQFADRVPDQRQAFRYVVAGVNHNGVSADSDEVVVGGGGE